MKLIIKNSTIKRVECSLGQVLKMSDSGMTYVDLKQVRVQMET